MTYDEFKNVSKEAKRRLAAKIIGLEKIQKTYGLIIKYPEPPCVWKQICTIDEWNPDESLDQVRLLELKAKADEKVWLKYSCLLQTNFDQECVEHTFNEIIHQNLIFSAEIAIMDADLKLFCLFQAFGVADKLKEGR